MPLAAAYGFLFHQYGPCYDIVEIVDRALGTLPNKNGMHSIQPSGNSLISELPF